MTAGLTLALALTLTALSLGQIAAIYLMGEDEVIRVEGLILVKSIFVGPFRRGLVWGAAPAMFAAGDEIDEHQEAPERIGDGKEQECEKALHDVLARIGVKVLLFRLSRMGPLAAFAAGAAGAPVAGYNSSAIRDCTGSRRISHRIGSGYKPAGRYPAIVPKPLRGKCLRLDFVPNTRPKTGIRAGGSGDWLLGRWSITKRCSTKIGRRTTIAFYVEN